MSKDRFTWEPDNLVLVAKETQERLIDIVSESAPAPLSLPRSIAWHLERLTDAEVARFCDEANLAPMTADEFRSRWDGDTWDDLAMLIYIRREDEPDGE